MFPRLRRRLRQYFTILLIILGAFHFETLRADAFRDYINQYSGLAIQQMETYGIPASITLAQGLLESGAGRSKLAREGNNHFGIKCHSDWTGRRMIHSDDRPDDCFRVYNSAVESFIDHSKFLRKNRYARLFDLAITDYEGWARGLKACGYATDPHYADRLISIIQLYSLQEFDKGGHYGYNEIPDFIQQMLHAKHVVRKVEGLHYVIAQPGDTYGVIAMELNMSVKKLLEYNDRTKDGTIVAWEEVYLQPKRSQPVGTDTRATIGEGQSLHSVAQRYGMTMQALKALNPNAKDIVGTELRLR